jgi:hypothetical protein
MDFLRAQADAFRHVGVIGVLLLLTNVVAGCALYDAFQNDPSGNNGGNNGEGCDGISPEWAGESCLQSCELAADFREALPEDKIDCETGVCHGVYGPDRPGDAVCLPLDKAKACSEKDLSSIFSTEFELCEGADAEYHVAAAPGAGFVYAGCARNSSISNGPLVLLTWLDSTGERSHGDLETRRFFEAGSSAQTLRVRDVLSFAEDTGAVLFEEDDGTQRRFVVGDFNRTSTTFDGMVPLVEKPAFSNEVFDQVEIVGSSSLLTFAVSDGDQVSATPLTRQGGTLAAAGSPSTWSVPTPGLRLQDMVAVSGRQTETNSDAQAFLMASDGAFARVELKTDSEGAAASVDFTQLQNIPAGVSDFVGPTSIQGRIRQPSSSMAFVTDGPELAGQARLEQVLRPRFESIERPVDPRTLVGAVDEQPVALSALGSINGTFSTSLEPQPSSAGNLVLALLTTVDDGGAGGPYGRVYGLDFDFETVWVRNVNFVPHDMAVTDAGRIAVSGSDEENAPKLLVMDPYGRGFCEESTLSTLYSEDAQMQ